MRAIFVDDELWMFKRLNETLSILHLDGIVEKVNSGAVIHTNVMDCDLYQFLDGGPKTMRQYAGAYMVGYEWWRIAG